MPEFLNFVAARHGIFRLSCGTRALEKAQDGTQDFARDADRLRAQEFARLATTLPPTLATLRALTPGLFREAVSAMFARFGYIDVTDDTVQDLVLRKAGLTYLVVCAPPARADPIQVPALARLHTAITTASAQAGYYVTIHVFAPEALAYAATAPLHLVNGARLATLMQESMAGVGLPETYQSMCRHCGALVQHRLDLSSSRFMVYCASHERRHHPWPVYGSPICSPAPRSSWISPA